MRRRGAGIGAIQKGKKDAERFKDKGNELAETNFQEMTKQMDNFRQNLEEFAQNHREEIKKNPEFRKHFQVLIALTTIVYSKILKTDCPNLSERQMACYIRPPLRSWTKNPVL